jgi:hypothetical protein
MDAIECENNFPQDFLSQAHQDFIAGFLELAMQREQALRDQFLKEK